MCIRDSHSQSAQNLKAELEAKHGVPVVAVNCEELNATDIHNIIAVSYTHLLPREKRVEIGLTYIYGIGLKSSQKILSQTGINPDTRVKAVSYTHL